MQVLQRQLKQKTMGECKYKKCTNTTYEKEKYCSDKCRLNDFWGKKTPSTKKGKVKKSPIIKKIIKKKKKNLVDITIYHLIAFEKRFPELTSTMSLDEQEEYLQENDVALKKVNSILFIEGLFKKFKKL